MKFTVRNSRNFGGCTKSRYFVAAHHGPMFIATSYSAFLYIFPFGFHAKQTTHLSQWGYNPGVLGVCSAKAEMQYCNCI